ncbi:hypothetical protein [Paraburkholderia bengalensis]
MMPVIWRPLWLAQGKRAYGYSFARVRAASHRNSRRTRDAV